MKLRSFGLVALGVAIFACGSDDEEPGPPNACAGFAEFRYENGSPDGHADPFGAKAASQARAGRVRDAAQIIQAPSARTKVRVGDFILANDKIALYIEAEGRASGYTPFGGEIIAIEPVGDDGKPKGVSVYNETLIALSRQTVKPEKVSVIADGSDGKAAIVRAQGLLTNIPFLDTFAALMPDEYDFPSAIDYVLEPGAEKVVIRLSFANKRDEPVDFINRQNLGLFHGSRSKIFTDRSGYAKPEKEQPYVAFDGAEGSAFLFRAVGQPLNADLEISGFRLFTLKGLKAEACEKKTVDWVEIATGSPGIDGLLETKRRVFGEPASREIKGTVKEDGGVALPGALVIATAPDGRVLTRVPVNALGEFTLHVPPGAAVLTPYVKGWALPVGTSVDGATADLVLPKRATIEVKITDAVTNEALPARVQIVPTIPPTAAPPSFGIREEVEGRLWQDPAITGTATLAVTPGEHRVIVSRGFEYEIFDAKVTAVAGTTTPVEAKIRRTVDSAGSMCADFHIHSYYSADSSDLIDEKVKMAIADGLEIPVSSEHEYIIDFQPVVQQLGLTKWAFGMASEELTTFTWGHFGVVPIYPKPDLPNNGAVDWIGKKPPAFFHEVATLPENPVFIVNHPSGTGFSAYFTSAQFDRAKGAGDPELWSEEFGAIEAFNESDFESNRTKIVADYFALLNAGKTYWVVGSSDSHDQRTTPVGYPRNCLLFGHDDPTKLTPETVRDVLRAGASVVSGGIFMSATGPDGIGPGGKSTAGAYKVIVQSPSWISATSLEVIVDGITTETIPLTGPTPTPETGRKIELTVNVAANASKDRHWVIFHAKGDGDLSPLHSEKKPFAVSNPIFF